MHDWLQLPDRRDEATRLALGDEAGRAVLRVLAEDADARVRDIARRALPATDRCLACHMPPAGERAQQ